MAITTEFLSDEIYVNRSDDTLKIKVYSDGVAVEPTTAPSYSIYDSGGNLKATDTADLDIGDDSVLNLCIAESGNLFPAAEANCHIQWNLTIGSNPYIFINIFDVVNYKIVNTVTDDDLKIYFPQIGSELYKGQTNYDPQIQEAFRLVKRDIKNKGERPVLMMDAEQVKYLIILKALEIIFLAFPRDTDSIWQVRYLDIQKKYQEELKNTPILWDIDEDAVPDSEVKFSTVRLTL